MFIVVRSVAEQKKALSVLMQPVESPSLDSVASARPFVIRTPRRVPLAPLARPKREPRPVVEEAPLSLVESNSTEGFKVTQLPSNTRKSETIRVAEPPSIPEPEQLEEKKDKPKAFLNRDGQLKRFVSKLKKKGKHWIWVKWNGTEPHFSVDGKSMPARKAAWCLYHGLAAVPEGMEPYAQCHTYNCLSKECLILVEDSVARNSKKVNTFDLNEILRLRSLGKSNEEIADIIQKHDPMTVHKVIRRAT